MTHYFTLAQASCSSAMPESSLLSSYPLAMRTTGGHCICGAPDVSLSSEPLAAS
jgi:hypothetical protein